MIKPEILCTVRLAPKEARQVEDLAAYLHMTWEEVLRTAVNLFSGACVPTHQVGNKSHELGF